jgi:hypothetical protein
MVYGEYGRTGIYDVQRMMRILKPSILGHDNVGGSGGTVPLGGGEDEERQVQFLRTLLAGLPTTSRVKHHPAWWDAVSLAPFVFFPFI